MKPWCAEGDVPTAANLNLYRGRSSRGGWHSDNEPLFGEYGDVKLIVSVMFRTGSMDEDSFYPITGKVSGGKAWMESALPGGSYQCCGVWPLATEH